MKWSWAGLAVVALLVSLAAYDGRPNSDAENVLGWSMLLLAFPSSLLFAAGFAVIAEVLESHFQTVIRTSYSEMTISWAVLFALGYAQWFIVAPWLIGKLRRARRAPRGDAAKR